MPRAKKVEEPVEATVVEPVEVKERRAKKYRYGGSIFWGLTFIFVGVLVLLDNLNIITVHFGNLWQLWPVLIIGAGVSMLSLRGWLSGLVSTLLALAFIALGLLVAVENPYYNIQNMWGNEQVTSSTAQVGTAEKELDITVRTGAIDLALMSAPTQEGYAAELHSRRMTLSQSSMETRDGVKYVTLETDTKNGWFMGMGMIDNRLTLDLTRKVPVSVHVDTGASSISGDLSNVQLKTLTLKAGASSIDLKLGAVSVKQDITLDAGASSVRFALPKSVGVRVEADNGLSHTDFDGVDKVSDGVYETAGFSTAERQVTVHAKIGASSFEITRY